MDDMVAEECLEDAKKALKEKGGTNVEKLAKAVCILSVGVIDIILAEIKDD